MDCFVNCCCINCRSWWSSSLVCFCCCCWLDGTSISLFACSICRFSSKWRSAPPCLCKSSAYSLSLESRNSNCWWSQRMYDDIGCNSIHTNPSSILFPVLFWKLFVVEWDSDSNAAADWSDSMMELQKEGGVDQYQPHGVGLIWRACDGRDLL